MPTDSSTKSTSPASFAWICDAFAFSPSLGKLYRRGQITHLTPKVSAVLNCLCHKAPHIINKLEILAEVWAKQEIADTAVTDAVRTIRQALAEQHRGEILETVPKQGYRITTQLEQISTQAFDRMVANRKQSGRHRTWLMMGLVLIMLSTLWLSQKQPTSEANSQQNTVNDIHQRSQDFYTRYNKTGNSKAQALLETAIKQHPNEAKPLSALADVYSQNIDRYADTSENWGPMALNTAQLATAADSQYPPAWKSLGLAHAVLGEIEQAKKAYRHAIKLNPDYFAAISNLAHLERVQGHTAAALELFMQAHQLMSNDPYIYFHIANCYQDVGLYDLADNWYQQGMLLQPEMTSDQHHYHLNLLYQHDLDTLDQLLKQQAPSAAAYVRYMRMLMAQKTAHTEQMAGWFDLKQRPLDASQAFAEEIVLLLISEPQLNGPDHQELKNWLHIMGEHYQQAIQNQTQSPTVHYRLAQVRAAQGQITTAAALLDQAVSLGFRNRQQLLNHSVFKWHLGELTALLKRLENDLETQREHIIKLYQSPSR